MALLVYAIQTMIYSLLFLLIYLVLLRDKPMHRFNRVFLLLAASIPFVLPLVKLPGRVLATGLGTPYLSVRIPEIDITDQPVATSFHGAGSMLLLLYGLVTMLLLSFNIRKLFGLRNYIRTGRTETRDCYTLVRQAGFGPCSWGRYIFIPGEDADSRIITHEAAHIRLRHTVDLALILFLQSLFWYHPFLPILRRELQLVHEYQADEAAGRFDDYYGLLLLGQAFGNVSFPAQHSFFHHPIKRRIMMLNKAHSRISLVLRSIVTLAGSLIVLLLIVGIQSCGENEYEGAPDQMVAGQEIQTSAAKMPEFPGGQQALVAYLSQKLVYPENARKEGREGKVLVRFVVGKDGQVFGAEILKSPDSGLSRAALEVVRTMPAWVPAENEQGTKVPVFFVLPVSFRLG